MTFAGAVVGMAAYLSPEQLRGAEVDARSDQFSFCVALYEALYGQRAFGGETLPALLESVKAGAVRAAPVGSTAPEWLLPLLRRGLAASRAERFPDMPALLAELGRDVQGDPRQGATARRRLAIRVALTIVGVSTMLMRQYLASGVPIADPNDFVRTSVVAFVTFAGGVAVFGRGLLRNRYHRAVLGLSLITALQMVLVRSALVVGGASIPLILLVDFITTTGMFAVGGVLVARWLAWVAVLPAIGAVVTVVAPELAPFVAQLV